MNLIDQFLSSSSTSLKVCGVTTAADAHRLVDMGVPAIGVNFWPHSKRYLNEVNAGFLRLLKGKTLRVGVFVNEDPCTVLSFIKNDLIDIVQLHGDESPDDAAYLREHSIPFIKAIGVKHADSLTNVLEYGANAILLDAHAPDVYGGTGNTFDWNLAIAFIANHPKLPVVLAGGINTDNAAEATHTVRPAALDVASGSESSPGVKDFDKVRALMLAVGSV